ncbi:MAG: glycerol-3-phosphate 1-O-acyltransferase PlsY [Ignavibacteriae bacterium]|nr:glycerol-3-phosphate 1-O-acyltransferase PlsY [Ignavibacteria bacterium]MBI3363633.1 glycerol-3-phosphate 1-O-acyltransferase PlsY [Ignavibacteriota bacterium]
MLPLALIVVLSYLVGSFPTSIIVGKLAKGIDVRSYGSGNAGGTNVIRVLGWKAGVFVILFDIFKGYIAAMVLTMLMYGPLPFPNATPFEDITVIRIIAGCAAILGHVWTAFGGFRGGKGMATAGGVLLGLATIEVLVALGVFLIAFIISRYVSLSSISAAIALPVTMLVRHNIFHAELQGYHTLIFVSIGISILLLYTHRSNIKRLLAGTEHRLSRIHIGKHDTRK